MWTAVTFQTSVLYYCCQYYMWNDNQLGLDELPQKRFWSLFFFLQSSFILALLFTIWTFSSLLCLDIFHIFSFFISICISELKSDINFSRCRILDTCNATFDSCVSVTLFLCTHTMNFQRREALELSPKVVHLLHKRWVHSKLYIWCPWDVVWGSGSIVYQSGDNIFKQVRRPRASWCSRRASTVWSIRCPRRLSDCVQ